MPIAAVDAKEAHQRCRYDDMLGPWQIQERDKHIVIDADRLQNNNRCRCRREQREDNGAENPNERGSLQHGAFVQFIRNASNELQKNINLQDVGTDVNEHGSHQIVRQIKHLDRFIVDDLGRNRRDDRCKQEQSDERPFEFEIKAANRITERRSDQYVQHKRHRNDEQRIAESRRHIGLLERLRKVF